MKRILALCLLLLLAIVGCAKAPSRKATGAAPLAEAPAAAGARLLEVRAHLSVEVGGPNEVDALFARAIAFTSREGGFDPWPRSATRLEYCDSRNAHKTWESQWLARTRSVSWCRNSTAFNRPRLAHFSFTRAISESIATRPLQDSCATSSRWRNGTLLNVPAGAKRPRPDRALRCRRRSRDRTGVAPRAYHDRPSIVPRPAKTSAARSGPTKSEQPRGHRRVSSAGGRPSWGAMASTTLPTSAWRSRRAPTGGGPKGRRRAA